MTKVRKTRRRTSSPNEPRALAEPSPGRRAAAAVLLVFAVGFVALEVNAYTRKSATWDEPIHLTSGYAALTEGDYRIDPSHPPFLRIWASLPLLFGQRPTLDTATIDRAEAPRWLQEAYGFAHRFLYIESDADRLLYPARFMVVLLGVALGILLFCWVNEWLGFMPAVIALALYAMEPNIAAHATLVTTDFGMTCFTFGTVYFLWRTARRTTIANVAGVATFFALAIVTKFSAIVLLPIAGLLLATAVRRRVMTARFACGLVGVLIAAAFVAVWAAYAFRYAPSTSPGWSFQLHDTEMGRRAPALASLVGWSDRHQILPNAFTQGVLYSQTSVQEIGAFLAGRYSTDGWWYYFPFAFAIKTPIALLALLAAGALVLVRRRRDLGSLTLACVVIPLGVYLSVAMASGVNLGIRHILPIYPFVLLIAAATVADLVARGRAGRLAVASVVLVWAVEFGSAYPHNLTFFNQLAGGSQNGFRYLSDSNLGWGQNLKPLKAWMDRRGVRHINLAYFGQADPSYYMIDCTYLPGSPSFALSSIMRPELPGYVAISPTILTGVYLSPQWRLFYRPFLDLTPVAVIGNSIRVYWLDRWPEATGRYGDTADVATHRLLADILLFGQNWPTRAVRHYREYLKYHPNDADALVNAGVALVAANQMSEALMFFTRAVDADPDHHRARLMLARALLVDRDLAGAALHVEYAVALAPGDADTRDLLGRVRAVQGRLDDAAREFERALAIDPAHAQARDHLSRIREAGRP